MGKVQAVAPGSDLSNILQSEEETAGRGSDGSDGKRDREEDADRPLARDRSSPGRERLKAEKPARFRALSLLGIVNETGIPLDINHLLRSDPAETTRTTERTPTLDSACL